MSGPGLYLTGLYGDYASTPDHAALDITGDLDIRVDLSLDSWDPTWLARYLVSKYAQGGNYSYAFRFDGDNLLSLIWSENGNATKTPLPSVSPLTPTPPPGTRLALRAVVNVDNDLGGRTVIYYTASTMAGPWTIHGSMRTANGTTSIFAGSAPLEVGMWDGGSAGKLGSGIIHALEVRNGIGGTIVANPDFAAQAAGATSFTDGAGRLWTVHGNAEIQRPDLTPPPGPPTMAFTWFAEYAALRIVVNNPPTPTATLWRRAGQDLAAWTQVRSAINVPTTTAVLIAFDFEMPIDGQNVTYAITAGTTPPDVDTPTFQTFVAAIQPWLRHLGTPRLSQPVIVQSYGDVESPGRVGVYEVIGRVDPVTVHDVRGSRRGGVVLLTRTGDAAADMRAIVADGAPLLLQTNNPDADFADCYMALSGVSVARVLPSSTRSQARLWSLEYTEVARPVGEQTPFIGRTYADVLVAAPTYADVRALYADYLAMML